jgi:hypothetical protein
MIKIFEEFKNKKVTYLCHFDPDENSNLNIIYIDNKQVYSTQEISTYFFNEILEMLKSNNIIDYEEIILTNEEYEAIFKYTNGQFDDLVEIESIIESLKMGLL